MSFWEDLSPGVKRYLIFAAVALAALLVFKQLQKPPPPSEAPPRGLQH